MKTPLDAPPVHSVGRSIWLYPLSTLTGISMAAFFLVHQVDVVRGSAARATGFWDVFFTMTPADAAQVMGGIGEVIVA